jgi:hypothetical protein
VLELALALALKPNRRKVPDLVVRALCSRCQDRFTGPMGWTVYRYAAPCTVCGRRTRFRCYATNA